MSAIDEAKNYLATTLAEGPRPVGSLKQWAADRGINERTLRRAKEAIGVEAKRVGKGWIWALPEDGHHQDDGDQATGQVDQHVEDSQQRAHDAQEQGQDGQPVDSEHSTSHLDYEDLGAGLFDEGDLRPVHDDQPVNHDDQPTDQYDQAAEEDDQELTGHSPDTATERTDTTAAAHFHDDQDANQPEIATDGDVDTATAHFLDEDSLSNADEGDDLESNDHDQGDDAEIEDEYLNEDDHWYGQDEPETTVKQNLGIIDYTLAAATGGVFGVCIGIYAEYWGLL